MGVGESVCACVCVCVCVHLSYMCHLRACHCFQISSLQLYSFQMDFVLVPTGSYQSFELKKNSMQMSIPEKLNEVG